jgi:hypothetical protein
VTKPGVSRQAPHPYRVDYGDSEPHRRALAQGLAGGDLTLEQLWVRAFGLGAQAGLADVAAYVEGLMPLPALERDVLAQAMNEHLAERAGPLSVPYTRTMQPPRPSTGPLAALVTLLDGARYCPPERLPRLATAAAQAVGVRGAVIYLTDYEQHELKPLVDTDPPGLAPLPVEGSLAGRAFQTGRAISALSETPPRYWIPILDGDERLGALGVMLDAVYQLDDPNLREQCQWLAAMLGHLIAGLDAHGDSIDTLRRNRSSTASAELVWALLPPLTAGIDGFVVSGLLAPADDLGGDIFDYALSHSSVSLAVFDAMGHGISAGIIAAAAVSAYRAARRAGHDLHAQATAIDQTVAALFPDAYVTAILAELDLDSGRIRYLNAGHLEPLLLRAGRVIATLRGGRRLPLGFSAQLASGQTPTLGEAGLEPGDCLALYTDGVTEARAANGAFFGDKRLIDCLERAASSGQPPPETVRRLLHAVLHHQDGVLQDDATLLLAQWGRFRAADQPNE